MLEQNSCKNPDAFVRPMSATNDNHSDSVLEMIANHVAWLPGTDLDHNLAPSLGVMVPSVRQGHYSGHDS